MTKKNFIVKELFSKKYKPKVVKPKKGKGSFKRKKKWFYLFLFLSLFNFLFSLRESFGFFITVESLNDFPLYLFDMIIFNYKRAPIRWITFDDISVPFSKHSFWLFLLTYPCK